MLDPNPELRPTAETVARALDQKRFGWRPHRRSLRWAAVTAAIAMAGVAMVVFGPRLTSSPPDPANDPVANELMVSVESFDNGTVHNVVDGHGLPVHSFHSKVARNIEKQKLFKTRRVGIADLDGDGRRDLVFADPDHVVAEQLEIHRRLADGSTEPAASWNLHMEVEYEGERFGKFAPIDIECADLSGDGEPEIIVVCGSSPYYAAAVRVFRPDGAEVLRVLHPGQIANVRTGDRNRDGRAEIYVGATNNFHEQNHGNSSSPVLFVVEADWTRTDQELDLFGPGRTMAATTPDGIETHYIALTNQRLLPPVTPWRYCVIESVTAAGGDQFLAIHADRMIWKDSTKLTYLRAFMFDRDLRLTDGMWVVGPLEEREIDPTTASPEQLAVNYWNGSVWQPEVCAIPQAVD